MTRWVRWYVGWCVLLMALVVYAVLWVDHWCNRGRKEG